MIIIIAPFEAGRKKRVESIKVKSEKWKVESGK